MRLSVNAIFAVAAIFVAGLSIGMSIFLYFNLGGEVLDLFFDNGLSQTDVGITGVQGQLYHMQGRAQANLALLTYLAATNNISTPAVAATSLLSTVQGLTARDKGLDTRATMIDVLTLLYYDESGNVPIGIQSMACAYDFSLDVVYCAHTEDNGIQNEAYLMNVSGPVPQRIPVPEVLFNYNITAPFEVIVKNVMSGKDNNVTTEQALTWTGLDLKPFWYTSGVAVENITDRIVAIATAPESIPRRWLPVIQRYLGPEDEIILVDSNKNVLATSLDDEIGIADCQKLRQAICPELKADVHPTTFIRDLYLSMHEPEWDDAYGPAAPTSRKTVESGDTKYLVVAKQVVQDGPLKMIMIWARPRSGVATLERRLGVTMSIVTIVVIICLLLLLFLQMGALLRPISRIGTRMSRVADLEIYTDKKDAERSVLGEVADIQQHFESMNDAILSFAKYVPRDIVKKMLTSGGGVAELGIAPKNICAFFVDIADFTIFCEHTKHIQLTPAMNNFFSTCGHAIHLFGGTIDKYIGDCVMALWNAPNEVDQMQTRASLCSLYMVHMLSQTTTPSFRPLGFKFSVRVGMNCGDALVGNMGSESRLNYSALGDTVNTASRLEALGKQMGSVIMLTEDMYRALDTRAFKFRNFSRGVEVRGKLEPVKVYELYGLTEEFTESDTVTNILNEIGARRKQKGGSSSLKLEKQHPNVVIPVIDSNFVEAERAQEDTTHEMSNSDSDNPLGSRPDTLTSGSDSSTTMKPSSGGGDTSNMSSVVGPRDASTADTASVGLATASHVPTTAPSSAGMNGLSTAGTVALATAGTNATINSVTTGTANIVPSQFNDTMGTRPLRAMDFEAKELVVPDWLNEFIDLLEALDQKRKGDDIVSRRRGIVKQAEEILQVRELMLDEYIIWGRLKNALLIAAEETEHLVSDNAEYHKIQEELQGLADDQQQEENEAVPPPAVADEKATN